MAPGGYAWWYLDALSDDGRQGLTVIAFVGSVFSPYYAWRRERGDADPIDHCAINVALYGPQGKRWAMTERGRGALVRSDDHLAVGRSSLTWDGTSLALDLDETTFPLPSRVRGRVRVHPAALGERSYPLDAEGRHRWRPIAPTARVEVALDAPGLAWSGTGYLDANAGDEPLERGFAGWHWSRGRTRNGTTVCYDVRRRDGEATSLALHFRDDGSVAPFAPPPVNDLPRTLWRIERATRADARYGARVLRTFEDTPFYARSLVATRLDGEPVQTFHESLSLDRFSRAWVRCLLPFRMPRRARA